MQSPPHEGGLKQKLQKLLHKGFTDYLSHAYFIVSSSYPFIYLLNNMQWLTQITA